MNSRRAGASLLAVAAATVLTACSGSDSSDDTSTRASGDSATTSASDSSTRDAAANACLAVGHALTSARIPSADDIPPLTEIDTVKFVAGEAADFVGVLRTSGVIAESVDAVQEGFLQVASSNASSWASDRAQLTTATEDLISVCSSEADVTDLLNPTN